MWSIERIDQPEAKGKDSDTDPQKMTIKMICIQPTTAPLMVDEKDEDSSKEIKEQGYKLGAKGNQSETNFLENLKRLVSVENALEREYEEAIKRTPKTGMLEIEDILWKQIEIERNKVKVYETAYIQEKLFEVKSS